MSPEKAIRLQTKNKLGDNNWAAVTAATVTVAVAIMIIMYLCYAVDAALTVILESMKLPDFLSENLGLFSISVASALLLPLTVLISPLFMGLLRYIYLLVKEENVAFSQVFYYIGRRYTKTLGVTVMFLLRNLWKIVVSFLPSYLADTVVTSMTYEKIENAESLAFSDIMCYVIVYAMLFGGILLCMKLCSKQFLYFYLYIEDETLSSGELSQRSEEYMQRFTPSVMKLFLSLFPWILSCILVVPCIFVVPYVTATLSTSAKWIIALHDNSGNKDE